MKGIFGIPSTVFPNCPLGRRDQKCGRTMPGDGFSVKCLRTVPEDGAKRGAPGQSGLLANAGSMGGVRRIGCCPMRTGLSPTGLIPTGLFQTAPLCSQRNLANAPNVPGKIRDCLGRVLLLLSKKSEWGIFRLKSRRALAGRPSPCSPHRVPCGGHPPERPAARVRGEMKKILYPTCYHGSGENSTIN